MSIADELNHLAGDIGDAYDAVNDMNGIVPANKNMDNLDTAIRTIPQPTVNDGTLTIQKNGTSVATFTANQASNATANITVPTNTSDLNNDSGFITSSSLPGDMTGATSGVAGTHGLVPAPAAGDESKFLKGDGTWGEASEKFVIMKYGESSAWAKFIDAYNNNKIVYCRASSNANPATGAQTRLAFMAYVSAETNPTNVEFQYVRSVGSKTSAQPVDQVFVYKLTNANGGTWSVETRDMAPKLAAGTNTSVSYSSGTYTVSATDTTYSDFTGTDGQTAGTAGLVPAPATTDAGKFLKADGTWETVSASSATTLYITDKKNSEVQSYSSYPTQVRVFTDSGYTTDIVSTDLMDLLSAGPVNVIIDAQYGTYVTPGVMVSAFSTSGTSSFHIFTQDYLTQTSGTKIYSFTASMSIAQYTGVQDTYVWNGSGGTPATTNDIGSGVLTIQRNGTTVDTFSANASANKTIDIDVNNGILTAWNLVPTADTTAGWRTLFPTDGVYVTFYDGNGSFTNKPSGWGVLTTKISYHEGSTTNFEIYQEFMASGNSSSYFRKGNTNGWYGNSSDSGSFTMIYGQLSSPIWRTAWVASQTQAKQTIYLTSRNTCDIVPDGQGGVIVDNLPYGYKMVRFTQTQKASFSGKKIGIRGLKASTSAFNRFSGISAGTTKNWSQYSMPSVGSNNITDAFSDGLSSTQLTLEYTCIRCGTGNEWTVAGTLSDYGANTHYQFSILCEAKDATTVPNVFFRGTSSSDFTQFYSAIEILQ